MSIVDNRPQLSALVEQLAGVPDVIMQRFGPPGYPVLQSLLDASIAYVEDVATTAFNSTAFYSQGHFELYDGNTTNQIVVRKRPVLSVQKVQVVTPILGYTRVYSADEIKNYIDQGVIKVFTYKLAVEQALLQTVDYQAWGSLFPPLPQAVQIAYTYGYPLYDDDDTTPRTSFDGGLTWEAGDQREPMMVNWLLTLQRAALCDAAASFLSQVANTTTGIVQSVSFDGYSRSMNPMAFSATVQALIQRRDELLKRRRRAFYMSTVGGH